MRVDVYSTYKRPALKIFCSKPHALRHATKRPDFVGLYLVLLRHSFEDKNRWGLIAEATNLLGQLQPRPYHGVLKVLAFRSTHLNSAQLG